MTPAPAFIIPVLNEAPRIAPLLRDLRRRFPAARLIVVDGGSGDGTVREALPLCDELLIGQCGRALQMNLGAAVSQSDYLLFLHADTRPQFGAQELSKVLAAEPDWGFCRVRLDGGRRVFRVIEWFINRRARITRIGTGDQMLFARRSLFARCGGFDAIPLMEDVAWCKRLRRLAPPLVADLTVLTSSRRWEEGGVVVTILRMWALRAAFALGVSPQRLWQHYYGR